ncbi:hypothetical protein GCM10028811_16650 [Uliginosibacterium sediminicola]
MRQHGEERETAHIGQHQVDQYEIEVTLRLNQSQRLLPAGSLRKDALQVEAVKRTHHGFTHQGVVFDNQNPAFLHCGQP